MCREKALFESNKVIRAEGANVSIVILTLLGGVAANTFVNRFIAGQSQPVRHAMLLLFLFSQKHLSSQNRRIAAKATV